MFNQEPDYPPAISVFGLGPLGRNICRRLNSEDSIPAPLIGDVSWINIDSSPLELDQDVSADRISRLSSQHETFQREIAQLCQEAKVAIILIDMDGADLNEVVSEISSEANIHELFVIAIQITAERRDPARWRLSEEVSHVFYWVHLGDVASEDHTPMGYVNLKMLISTLDALDNPEFMDFGPLRSLGGDLRRADTVRHQRLNLGFTGESFETDAPQAVPPLSLRLARLASSESSLALIHVWMHDEITLLEVTEMIEDTSAHMASDVAIIVDVKYTGDAVSRTALFSVIAW